MAFLNQFSAYFDYQDKQTELYALWSAIGVNMEKSFLEEQNKLNAELTDINNFSDDTMRSWLAFFLQKIPYRTSATSQVTISMESDSKLTTIPKYAPMTTDSGVAYVLMEEASLIKGDTRTITAVQGKRITETGVYNSIIKVQANNPDLSYIEVKLNGESVPEVSYETSYDQLKYIGSWKPQSEEGKEWGGTPFLQDSFGAKGSFYNVIADGYTQFDDEGITIEFRKGDLVVYDGKTWQKSAYTNNLTPIQFTNSYAVPRNGFFAYYYNNYLYIKIFSGSQVANPNGMSYEVNYIQSDGIQGQIKENELSFVSTYEDVDENKVELRVRNTASSAAVNEPSVGKLGLYLKQRLYSTINVSSIPEYTNWFNAQPEVGDCMVLSDWEKYRTTGVYEQTGIIEVYLVGTDGKQLSNDVCNELLDRITPYKDVGVLMVKEFVTVKQYLKFEYSTATNQDAFVQFCKSKASQYYNLNYLQSKGSSLFGDLDLAAIIEDILSESSYNSTGLVLKGYHYKEEPFGKDASGSWQKVFDSYADENPGSGYYEFEDPVNTDNNGNKIVHKLVEVPSVGDDNSALIYDELEPTVLLGSHLGTTVSLDLSSYGYSPSLPVTLKCYWGMKNEGILSMGAVNGLRELVDVEVEKV